MKIRDFNRYENGVLDWALNTIMQSREKIGLPTDDMAAARIDLKLCDLLYNSNTERVKDVVRRYVLSPTRELVIA